MGQIVKDAKCIREVFDSLRCILYRPGDIDDIDLDNDVALCFDLRPEDRKHARDSALQRSAERLAEQKEMKKEGFQTLLELRQYKKQVVEEKNAESLKATG